MQALALLGRDAAVHEFVVGLGLVDETLEVRVFIFHWWEFVGVGFRAQYTRSLYAGQ